VDRGNATFDVRQRSTFNHVWQLPFFRQGHGFTVAALGDGIQWYLDISKAAFTGSPLT
jgi:hypothetical protein